MLESPRSAVVHREGATSSQCSARSSAGERSNKPPGRPAADQRRAARRTPVCCLIQPMSVCSAWASLIGARFEAGWFMQKMKFRRLQRLRHAAVLDAAADDRREALV